MHIQCLGINHNTASVGLREKLAFGEDNLRTALSNNGCAIDSCKELVILSTCNRIEIYSASGQPSRNDLEVFLSKMRGVSIEEFHPHLYFLLDGDAVRHLMKVSAGLDSLVLGEPQILGQVTKALEMARSAGMSGPLLTRLFQMAIHAGKRARAETQIARNPASVSSLAASLAERTAQNLSKAQIVVLGAGEMAELAVEALRKRGGSKITVVNRTLKRAQALAKRWQADALTFEHMETVLSSADVLISSTGAPHTIINPGMVSRIMRQRSSRPLVMIDIAVPRDIDPACDEVENVTVYDMDGLQVQLQRSLAKRKAETTHVQAILDEEVAGFMAYFDSLDMLPLITGVRQRAEAIRQAELNKTLRHMPGLSDDERARIEALTHALVKKLLDAPTHCLREQANQPTASEFASVARNLFGLPSGN